MECQICFDTDCCCSDYADPEDYDDSNWRDAGYNHQEPDPDGQDEELIDGVGFADPGGNSSLRAETPNNPRNLPCPTCGRENMLTPIDVRRHYQCNHCADRAERGF